MLRLVIEDDEGKTTVVPLIRDEITIGRKDGNTIRLTEWNVSRRHARLLRTGENGRPTVLLEDLDSYNGVKLNGDRIHGRCTVQPGDLIQIGDYSLALRVDAPEEGDPKTRVDAPPSAIQKEMSEYQAELLPSDEHARMVVVSSNLAGETFHVDRREVIVGRIQDNDIVINHRSISRNHAKIIVQNGAFTIVDLMSSNGVRVNGDDYGTATLINGDIIELGHVKLRFCAPGDDYVFSRGDINDVEVEPDTSTFKLVIIALLLVGIAVGTFFIVRQLKQINQPNYRHVQAPITDLKPPAAVADIDEMLVEGRQHLALKAWAEATQAFDRVLLSEPNHKEAQALKDRALAEADNLKKALEINKEIEAKRWSDAEFLLSEFPSNSVYAAEVAQKRTLIEHGYARDELARGLALLEEGSISEAEHLHSALTLKPFAAEEATRLADEIKRQRTSEEPKKAPRRPTTKPKRVAKKEPKEASPSDTPPMVASPGEEYEPLVKDATRLFVAGQRIQAARLFERAHQIKPSAIEPNQRLCAIYQTLGRKDRAVYHCTLHWQKEQDPATKANLKRIVDELKQ
ncbi:FHA domain-containing protein [Myxococcota bacterium]|nr:FHA domain-containing protein [Myxococcota bacterium]